MYTLTLMSANVNINLHLYTKTLDNFSVRLYNKGVKESETMIRYYRLFDMMSKRGMKKTDLREIVSPNTVAKLSKGEYVSGEVIDRLCTYFKCQPSDIMEVYKTVTYTDQFGKEQTKEVLVNQETMDLIKSAVFNPELWEQYAQIFPKDQIELAKDLLSQSLPK